MELHLAVYSHKALDMTYIVSVEDYVEFLSVLAGYLKAHGLVSYLNGRIEEHGRTLHCHENVVIEDYCEARSLCVARLNESIEVVIACVHKIITGTEAFFLDIIEKAVIFVYYSIFCAFTDYS